MKSVFLFSYSVEEARPLQKSLVAFVKNARFVIDWHAPYDGLILISSSETAKNVSNAIGDFFDDEVAYVISKLETGGNHGSLTDESWSWLRANMQNIVLDEG